MITLYSDVEDLCKAWVLSTSVASLVENKVFLAMPKGSPLPSITLSRVGGGLTDSTVPTDSARISFSVWAATRPKAKSIARTLVSEADNLSDFSSDGGVLRVAEVLTWMWMPDPNSDTPRYVIDIRFQCTPEDDSLL